MPDLSVGDVSGLIATGVFVLQLLFPLVFPAILIGFINDENTVVTWSVLGRFLQSSHWPTILQTDTTARHGVKKRLSSVMWFQTVSVLLISVAAIFTPLGLYQTIEPSGDRRLESFRFIQDDSAFGYGTPPRTTAPFTRSCGEAPCPGSSMNQSCVQQGLLLNCTGTVYDRSIPDALKSAFTEGVSRFAKPVSGIFDIQWRSQINASDPAGALGWYLKSAYRQISILILEPTVQLVDGLIVDARHGGIGFRNHTAPAPTHEYGSSWTEDILFVEPETQCVDLNVTFDFELAQDGSTLYVSHLALTDHGGFSKLSRTSPHLTIPPEGNGQGNIDLRERAYKAAWLSNFLTLAYFNATDPDPSNIARLDVTPGMSFERNFSAPSPGDSSSNSSFSLEVQAIRSSLYFGEYLVLPGSSSDRNKSAAAGNPFGISTADFSLVSNICAGGTISSPSNINTSLVGCGLIYGAARRTDGGSELSPDPGSKWTQPVYTCAASIRATIRTVTFQYNGTGLGALKVTATEPKAYTATSDLPLWGIENMHGLSISDAQPLWGILGPADTIIDSSLTSNISTIAQASIRLPGIIDQYSALVNSLDFAPTKAGENLPGADFYTQALLNAFSITRPGGVGYEGYGDYSGRTALALYSKWKNLTASADRVSDVVNLVWTDIAANSVVGTKGWGLTSPAAAAAAVGKRGADDPGIDAADRVPVRVYHRRVRYRVPYAVPAFVVLGITVVIVVVWLVLLVVGKTGTKKLRRLLDATSAGRTMGMFLWPDKASARGTDDWVKAVGSRVVVVSDRSIVAVESAVDQVEEGEPEKIERSNPVENKGTLQEKHSPVDIEAREQGA